jgi:hypothetical protein
MQREFSRALTHEGLLQGSPVEKLYQDFRGLFRATEPFHPVIRVGPHARVESYPEWLDRVYPSMNTDLDEHTAESWADWSEPVVSQINGNQGSATNTDDHSAIMGKRPGFKKAKTRPKAATVPTVLKTIAKAVAKEEKKKSAPRSRHTTPSIRAMSDGPRVSAPVATATMARSGLPQYLRTGFSETRIIHKEFVGNLIGSSAFTVQYSIPLQPGLMAPWLAQQAAGWEKYRFNRLRLHYLTRASTSTAGSYQLVPDYDAADSSPATEEIASTFGGVVEDAPWVDNVL